MDSRILEARFHPRRKAGGPWIVVGRVCCRGDDVRIEAACVDPRDEPGGATLTMLEKLRYLVGASLPKPFERLRQLRSEFWSFVEIPSNGVATPQGGAR
jgi:hypothetical protein